MKSRILVCEEDNDIASVIYYILCREGFECIVSDSYNCGKDLHVLPAAILLDYWEINGQTSACCLRLKEEKRTAHIPVVLISTATEIEKISKRSRADNFLRKPFDIDDLLAVVKGVLKN